MTLPKLTHPETRALKFLSGCATAFVIACGIAWWAGSFLYFIGVK